MRKIEKEEEQVAYQDPDKKIYHLCIVNLVIGYVSCRNKYSTIKANSLYFCLLCCAPDHYLKKI